jgi:hypothetical protein
MTKRRELFCFSLLTALTFFLGTGYLYANPDTSQDQQQFAQLLHEVDHLTDRIDSHASELDAFVRSPGSVSWQTHAQEWRQISEHLKEMTEVMDKLQALNNLQPWQENLAGRVTARIAAMIDGANKALGVLNKDRDAVEFAKPEYRARVALVHDFADNLDRLADYGRTRYEIEILKTELGV